MTKESENDFRKLDRRNIIGKLCDQMKTSEFSLDAELTIALNFLSYIHAPLHEYREPTDYVNKALSKRPDDIMALSNQAWMHWRRDKISEAWSIVEKLERLKERHDLIIIAKGEQAFAYSRFGPKYYKKAIDLYKNVITAAAQCEIEETYLHLWQFGLGLILKRQLHIENVFFYDHVSECVQSMNDAFDAFYNVSTKAKTIKIKARSWFITMICSLPKTKIVYQRKLLAKSLRSFSIGLMRYEMTMFMSLKGAEDMHGIMLTESVKIRETSFGHHHLAKTLTFVLNRDILEASDGSADRLPKSLKRNLFLEPAENSTNRNKYHVGNGKDLANKPNGERNVKFLSETDLKHFPNLSISYNVPKENVQETKGICNSQSHENHEVLVCNKDVAAKSEGFEQETTSFLGSQISQQHKVEKFMRSPQHILTYSPNDQRVTVILHHLDKAIQCSPANCTALYDKGIVLRNLGMLEEAVELFIKIRNKTECSPLQAVFCLEQQALCRKRQAELETQPLNMKDQEDDVKHLFFKAIETAADIAARVPRFHPRGTAFPSLREMLVIQKQNERLTSEDRNIYLEAYLEGALHALEQVDDEAAKERFKRIIRFCSRRRNLSEDDWEDCTYDLHIQTSENAEENGRSLYNIFTRTCGLKVSLNYNQTAEALKYDGQYEGVNDIMDLIVLLLDSDNLKDGALLRVSIDENIGNGIVAMCLGELRVPGEIEHFPVFLQPPDLDISKLKKEERHQWLKDFFSRAAEQPFPSKKPNEAEQTDSD
ncbi:hypothetical protein CHS0354_004884 [Potamilus streckersoni]|uniref:Uncharacterized protein n=1 Tax=Potamilus streckersoni TaxID=2493646 RepID=A0AAE0W0U5_9BIVA|nr:hypothetical protein CHS0354_004884 [Potamilus streckersoni]